MTVILVIPSKLIQNMQREYKQKNFPFFPENKIRNKDDFSDYMDKIKPNNYTQTRKITCG